MLNKSWLVLQLQLGHNNSNTIPIGQYPTFHDQSYWARTGFLPPSHAHASHLLSPKPLFTYCPLPLYLFSFFFLNNKFWAILISIIINKVCSTSYKSLIQLEFTRFFWQKMTYPLRIFVCFFYFSGLILHIFLHFMLS